MSDKLLERIAVALEAIAAKGGLPAGNTTGAATTKKTATTTKKDAPAATAEADPLSGAATEPPKKVTQEYVVSRLREVLNRADMGKDVVLAILQEKGGCTNINGLKPDKYEDVLAAVDEKLG